MAVDFAVIRGRKSAAPHLKHRGSSPFTNQFPFAVPALGSAGTRIFLRTAIHGGRRDLIRVLRSNHSATSGSLENRATRTIARGRVPSVRSKSGSPTAEPSMISLHDHHLRGFSVDVATKQLRLATELRGDSAPRNAVGVFDGVEGYVLDGDVLGTIIFDINEVDPVALYDNGLKPCRRPTGEQVVTRLGSPDAQLPFGSSRNTVFGGSILARRSVAPARSGLGRIGQSGPTDPATQPGQRLQPAAAANRANAAAASDERL